MGLNSLISGKTALLDTAANLAAGIVRGGSLLSVRGAVQTLDVTATAGAGFANLLTLNMTTGAPQGSRSNLLIFAFFSGVSAVGVSTCTMRISANGVFSNTRLYAETLATETNQVIGSLAQILPNAAAGASQIVVQASAVTQDCVFNAATTPGRGSELIVVEWG